jgi:hypothetical protein
MRVYRYLVLSKVALAVDTRPGKPTRLAVCVCNPADKYSRPTARFILNAMLDQTPETLRALNLRRNVFSLTYDGTTPVRDVLRPLLDSLESVLNSRMRSFETDADGTTLNWKQRANAVIQGVSEFARARLQRTRPTVGA